MGNSNNKFKMQSDINEMTEGVTNMQIDNVPGWISDTATTQLEFYRKDILQSMMRNDQQSINAWTNGDINIPVTDQNRKQFENNFFIYLKNLENENVGIPSLSDIMSMNKQQLIQVCKEYNIQNYSNKNKNELQDHIAVYFNY